jgi:Zn-dependent protease with chaperone function
MFVLRGIAVSLTFFVLLYCLLSLLVVGGWRYLKSVRSEAEAAHRQASLLFWSRVSPLLAAAFVTLVLVVPSFVLREPRSINEDMGLPLAFGLGCLLLFALGMYRVVAAQMRTARVVAGWLRGANAMDAGVTPPTFRAGRGTPPLTLVGVCSPRVLISEATVALLSKEELRVAVRHEIAHMRSRDNLKKLVFHCSPFPGMSGLENAWQEVAEIAADDGAVSSTRDALDLAAALIKLSRLIPVQAAPAFTMALVNGHRSISERVARLLAWNETPARGDSPPRGYIIPSVLALVLSATAFYSPVLTETHRITEWLVR